MRDLKNPMEQIGVHCQYRHRWARYDLRKNGISRGRFTTKAKGADRLRYDPQEWGYQPQAWAWRPEGLSGPAHNGEARIHRGASSSGDSRVRRIKGAQRRYGKQKGTSLINLDADIGNRRLIVLCSTKRFAYLWSQGKLALDPYRLILIIQDT
jgi:hypothetical protein